MTNPEEDRQLGVGVDCLVIGPIGNKFADVGSPERDEYEESLRVLEEVIVPACDSFGIEAIRADQINQPGEITEQTFGLLRDVSLVIADVTNGNSNVMYELGLRHTRNRCTIQIGEHGRLPFDISIIRTILFRRTNMGLIDAREELKAAVRECLQGNSRPVTATRLWNEAEMQQTSQPAPAPAPAEGEETEEEEPGFLELLAAMEEGLDEANQLITRAGEEIQRIGAIMSDATAEMARVDERGTGVSAGRLRIAAQVGTELEAPADELETIAEKYERAIEASGRGIDFLLTSAEGDPEQRAQLGELPQSIITASEDVREAMANGDELADIISSLHAAARPLRRPTQRIASALRRISRASAAIQLWANRARRLMETPA